MGGEGDPRAANYGKQCCACIQKCVERVPLVRQALPRVHSGFWTAYRSGVTFGHRRWFEPWHESWRCVECIDRPRRFAFQEMNGKPPILFTCRSFIHKSNMFIFVPCETWLRVSLQTRCPLLQRLHDFFTHLIRDKLLQLGDAFADRI